MSTPIELGLIGKSLKHSFSQKFFRESFDRLGWHAYDYHLFEIDDLSNIRSLINNYKLIGFNVTIPYKEAIIAYCDVIDISARQIGAVNCIKIMENQWIGFNTDCPGFINSLDLKHVDTSIKALICGSGGAAKAVRYGLEHSGIPTQIISRTGPICYHDVSQELIKESCLIVNTTPLGMYPDIDSVIPLPFEYITDKNYCVDLTYNPPMTKFMELCSKQGAKVQNGYQMLVNQAVLSFKHWTDIDLDKALANLTTD